jgi:molybdate transport system permease protein
MDTLWLSLEVAVLSVLIASVLAVSSIFVSQRASSLAFPGLRALLSSLMTLPLVLPPTVLGYYLLTLLGPNTALGRLTQAVTGSSLAFSKAGCVLAASISAMPVVFQSVQAALDAADPSYAESAASLGASPFSVFFRVQMPMARSGLLSGLVLGFARALGDFGATMMFAGSFPGKTRTASIAVYEAFQSGDLALANSLARTLALVGFVALFIASRSRANLFLQTRRNRGKPSHV